MELPLPRDAQPGYQVSATDLCLFAAKRRSVYLGAATSRPSSPSGAATTVDPTAVQSIPASTCITTTPRTAVTGSRGLPVFQASTGAAEHPDSYTLLIPVPDGKAIGTPSGMLGAASPRNAVSTASIPPSLVSERQDVLLPRTLPKSRMPSMARPQSMANIPTDVRTPAPTTNIYATTDRRRNANKHNTLAKSIKRRSLQSPTELMDGRLTSRTPLIAPQTHVTLSRTSPAAERIPMVASRSSLLRIPTESAV